jgi:hypothetical protein
MLTDSEFTFALLRSLARLANGFLFSFLAVKFLALEIQDLYLVSGYPITPFSPIWPAQPGDGGAEAPA